MDLLIRAAVEKAAVAKTVKGATGHLEPGTYEVRATVEIVGTITKGEDYESVIRPSIPIYDVLVAMLDEAGCVQQGTFERAYTRVADGFRADGALKEWAKKALSRLDDLGVQDCTGKTTANLTVEAFSEAEPYAVQADLEKKPVEL